MLDGGAVDWTWDCTGCSGLCFAVLMMSLSNMSILLAPIRGGQAHHCMHWIVEAVKGERRRG
jgi:hypothetical protein